MKITIERTHGKESRPAYQLFLNLNPREAFFPKAYHRLYLTIELTNEEKFVIEKFYRFQAFTVVEKQGRLHNINALDPKLSGRIDGSRRCVFQHEELDAVNNCEEHLRDGLKKWKAEIDQTAATFKKPKAKQSYEL